MVCVEIICIVSGTYNVCMCSGTFDMCIVTVETVWIKWFESPPSHTIQTTLKNKRQCCEGIRRYVHFRYSIYLYITSSSTQRWKQKQSKCQYTYVCIMRRGRPSTSDVRRESSVAFLRPGGRERPMESSLCRNTWPPFFDFALRKEIARERVFTTEPYH